MNGGWIDILRRIWVLIRAIIVQRFGKPHLRIGSHEHAALQADKLREIDIYHASELAKFDRELMGCDIPQCISNLRPILNPSPADLRYEWHMDSLIDGGGAWVLKDTLTGKPCMHIYPASEGWICGGNMFATLGDAMAEAAVIVKDQASRGDVSYLMESTDSGLLGNCLPRIIGTDHPTRPSRIATNPITGGLIRF